MRYCSLSGEEGGNVTKVVTACVILHNICVGVGDDLPPEDAALEEDNHSPAACEGGGESESGAAWRAALVNEVSALAVAPLNHDYFAQVKNMAQIPCHNLLDLEKVLEDKQP
ncbi:hypothetical protein NQZ68_000833 [Dissostichus eleginoides]|nr:hypothetical protein NQZ68_000833 [Dissostichus eleginoides]